MSRRSSNASPHQAEYARLRAVVDIRVAELVRALDAHERERSNWRRSGPLAAIDRKIAEALHCIEGSDLAEREMLVRVSARSSHSSKNSPRKSSAEVSRAP